MKRWKFILSLLIIALALAAFAGAAWACPMCKDSLATAKNDLQQTGGASIGGAFNKSIYTMIAGFFTALSIVAFSIGFAAAQPC